MAFDHNSLFVPPADYRVVPHWKQLLIRPEFPILEETRNRVHHALRDRQVNFQDLAPVVERDPALCLNLQLLTVQQNPECRHQISGAANCLSLIGMQELVRLVKRLPVISINTREPRELLYRTALQNAHLASCIAAWWTTLKGNNSVHYARWATLLLPAPLWSWLLHDDQAGNWLYFGSRMREPWQALQRISGRHIHEWQSLARKLALPPLAEDSWDPGKWPTLHEWRLLRRNDPWDLPDKIGRHLLHSFNQPHLTPLMASALAWHLHLHPQSALCRRWQTLASHWLGKPLHVWQAALSEAQLLSSELQDSSVGSGVYHWLQSEAEPLLYPWIAEPEAAPRPAQPATSHPPLRQRPSGELIDNRTRVARPNTIRNVANPPLKTVGKTAATETDKTVTAAVGRPHTNTATTASIPHAITHPSINAPLPATVPLDALQQRMRQDANSFGDWHQLMQALLRGMRQDLGLPWAAVTLLSRDKQQLRLVYQDGLPTGNPLQQLQVDLGSTSLFSKLLEQPAGIMVTSATRERLLRNLPIALQQALPACCLFMSLHAGSKPIGVVIADGGEENAAATIWPAFRALCQSGSQGLHHLRLARQNGTG